MQRIDKAKNILISEQCIAEFLSREKQQNQEYFRILMLTILRSLYVSTIWTTLAEHKLNCKKRRISSADNWNFRVEQIEKGQNCPKVVKNKLKIIMRVGSSIFFCGGPCLFMILHFVHI